MGFVRIFEYAIAFLVLVALVVFAVSNRGLVELNLFPLAVVIELPIYLALIGVLFVGVLVGGAVGFASSFGVRLALRSVIRQKRLSDKQFVASAKNISLQLKCLSPLPFTRSEILLYTSWNII